MQKIYIKKNKLKALDNRHPWIYSGAVAKMPESLEDGEIVEIAVGEKLLGYGFYAPGNQIVCRVFEYTRRTMEVLTQEYWNEKIASAYALRKSHVITEETNCFRLIHGEGDFFPGLIADVYNDLVSIQILIKGVDKIAPMIVKAIQNLGFERIYNKSKEISKRLENVETPKGWLTEKQGSPKVEVLENGVKFWVDVETGQKTGFFLDQRDARSLVGQYSKDKKVLNTFSYSGGFSMYALKAGATLVHSVDASQSAIDLCDENAELNGFNNGEHTGYCADVFDHLNAMESNDYDVVILDPPAFAKSSKVLTKAARGYKQLNLKAFRKIKKGGILFTFSCSQVVDKVLFRKIVFQAAAEAHRNVRILHQTSQPNCHPINIFYPENEYLKGLVLYVE
ncbi:class I SAM-dependent methyltransferase [Flammeovirga yaeyamensis]|uniref:Class I SAM-dependent methyltransferase n=1 Tax=Flammeovirga yaeyamensis TaxID=367791 RepID=A0AAX1N2Z3_9BACT|nr:class I SAM-dependent rRNA methyltransferase [Flammeovirga yaeyamensis]MBB3700320.1 23S rRNA (cytosine1962-C5)-methyltransferase [Flammeovirga yaeyamensis]NMF37054.1 class I SAM-dependent rRNA methyltransferase [Flammeovirga yaeyamensis]QWG00746.1 class I SAM-dependent methyltransferase [Flammeovirga yaeyamensis]